MKNFIVVLLLLFTNVFAQESIPLKINDYGLIFVKTKVNGEEGTFILDTGGGAHVLSQSFFEKVKNGTNEDGVYTGFRFNGERLDLTVYTAKQISVGNLAQQNPHIGVYPPLDEYGFDGLVSLKLFENQPFTIDFINSQLILETDESLSLIEQAAEILPIKFDKERDKVLDLFITVCLNDSVSLQAEFDTGSGFDAFILNKYYGGKLNLQLDSLNRTTINKVSLCGSSISQQNKKSVVNNDLIYEGLIGSGLFRNKKLTIDIPNKRILVR
jgi:hypothetical protein